MKIQTHEYIGFIKDFTGRTNIMSKTFFIIIPYGGGAGVGKPGGKGILGNMFPSGKKGAAQQPTEGEKKGFEEARIQLEQRTSIVEQGLARCDIRTTRIGTEEITELFYRKFNPGELDSAVTTDTR